MGIISFIFALAEDMLLAAIPAVGFAMVFNVPQRALRWCALLGVFGRDDDFAAEQFFKGLFDCGRPFDWPVDTRPVAVS